MSGRRTDGPITAPSVSYTRHVAPDGVATGFCDYCGKSFGASEVSNETLRSFVDRLGKAARKADTESVAAAWIAVGRVQAALAALIVETPSATRGHVQEPTESILGTEGPQ